MAKTTDKKAATDVVTSPPEVKDDVTDVVQTTAESTDAVMDSADIQVAPSNTSAEMTPVENRIQMVKIRAVGVPRRCRAGLCFDEEGQVIDPDSLTPTQQKALGTDPHLQIEVVSIPATPADSGGQ